MGLGSCRGGLAGEFGADVVRRGRRAYEGVLVVVKEGGFGIRAISKALIDVDARPAAAWRDDAIHEGHVPGRELCAAGVLMQACMEVLNRGNGDADDGCVQGSRCARGDTGAGRVIGTLAVDVGAGVDAQHNRVET
jgi:hypothetical protein